MKRFHWQMAVLMVCVMSATVSGKGPTTRIVIAASSLASPIDITDPDVLRGVVIWSGAGVTVNSQPQAEGFIVDWSHDVDAERPVGLPRYEVSFYAKYANQPLESQQEHLAYVVLYEPDPARGQGYVYFPGKGEDRYALNVRTIHRGREGHWLRATDAWNQVALKAIAGTRARPAAE